MTYYILLRDITADDLAMAAPEGEEGYPADHVIGPAGSRVRLLDRDNDLIEVTDFANDPYAAGYIPSDAVRLA